MSRLPYLKRQELDEQGRAVWDSLATSRGGDLVNDDGGLVGPFNAWVHAPGVGARMSGLGAELRFGTSLERRLLELAIITVGAFWQAEFEWWAHARMAREHGVSDEVIDAIGRDVAPTFEADDERVVHAVARQLVESGQIDASIYCETHGLLGDRGLVELVSLCGYYTLVSFTLNAFSVPLPPGVEPAWGSIA
jgi:4-carboxymuconolactone decarboxylase